MSWNDQDYQSVHDLYHDLWPDRPAEGEWEEFARVMKLYPRAKVEQALRAAKYAQQGRNFRPAMGDFVDQIHSLCPRNTMVPPDGDLDPSNLLQDSVADGSAPDWLQSLIVRSRHIRGMKETAADRETQARLTLRLAEVMDEVAKWGTHEERLPEEKPLCIAAPDYGIFD